MIQYFFGAPLMASRFLPRVWSGSAVLADLFLFNDLVQIFVDAHNGLIITGISEFP